MKTLNYYINEWRLSNSKDVKHDDINFIYRIDETGKLKIFNYYWKEFKTYKNNIFIDNKQVELDDKGCTVELFNKGVYKIYIKDINKISNCYAMFWSCWHLISVPFFDTSNVTTMTDMFRDCKNLTRVPLFNTEKVTNMNDMFYLCDNLVDVPLFNTKNVKSMDDMFLRCRQLSEETKEKWSNVYDFETNKMK